MTPVPKTPGYSKAGSNNGLKTQHGCKQQTLSRVQMQETLVFKETKHGQILTVVTVWNYVEYRFQPNNVRLILKLPRLLDPWHYQ